MQSIKVNYITPDELYQLVDFKNIDVAKVIPGFDPSAGFILSSPAYFTPPEENQQPVIQCDTPATLPSPSSSPSPTQTESEKPFVSQVETGASLPSADRENPSAVDLSTAEPPRSSPPINTEVQEAVAKFGIVEKLSEVSPPSPQFPSISKVNSFENRNLKTEIDELSPRELEAKDQVSEDDFEGCKLALDLSINMESNTELRQNLDPWYTVNVLMEDECPSVQHMTFGECPAWLTQQPNQRVEEKLSIKAFQELINTTCNSSNNNNNNNSNTVTNTVSNKGKDSSIGCSEERNGAAPISPDRDEEIENKDCSSSVYSDPDDHEPHQKDAAAANVADAFETFEDSLCGNCFVNGVPQMCPCRIAYLSQRDRAYQNKSEPNPAANQDEEAVWSDLIDIANDWEEEPENESICSESFDDADEEVDEGEVLHRVPNASMILNDLTINEQTSRAQVATDAAHVDHVSEANSSRPEVVADELEKDHVIEPRSSENEVAKEVTPTDKTVFYVNPRDNLYYMGVSRLNPNYGRYYSYGIDIHSVINPTLSPLQRVPDGIKVRPVPNVRALEYLESGTEYVVDEARVLKKRVVKFANEVITRKETEKEIIDMKSLMSMNSVWQPMEIVKREPIPKEKHPFWNKCLRKLKLKKPNTMKSNENLKSVLKKPTMEVEEATGLRRCKSCIILDAPELKKEDERPKTYQRVTRPNSS
ncbi:hypothetical protein KGF57_000779 [Candida theae]|uniref:Uncharacterized protein n=1 Tax=Candida theae TaxID=1198502 RepID=A0AAD5BIC6_9ASCO|nr:uncharacterized protein KGF57_000779 [Candida theae]KAI5965513.1 hypothetical protein KGF57_000779 [Candida theae]